MNRSLVPLLLFIFPILPINGAAQENGGIENNQSLFEELDGLAKSPYRTGAGKPSPSYWQNTANYNLKIHLDDEQHLVKGKVEIEYTNNSPNELKRLWVHLEQNKFKKGSRGRKTVPPDGGRFKGDTTNGHVIRNVRIQDGSKQYEPSYLIDDTRMRVELHSPLKPGNTIDLDIDFQFMVPEYGADRMGRLKVEDGWIYEIAQWYPRMCVYDDINGWNVEPYLGTGEFYLDYGDFTLELTVPHDHIVAASGELLNPEEVLTDEQVARSIKAFSSEKTNYIIKPDEAGDPDITRPEGEDEVTWRFRIEKARGMAWASSPAFIWDAAAAEMPSGRTVKAMSYYPRESAGDTGWGRSTEYTKESIEHYSEQWFEYPYPTARNVAGIVGGMEYPGLSFCHWKATKGGLWGVTDHEFGHNWFPMVVGSNERLYAWMDEGLNTFINYYSTLDFNDGEYNAEFTDIRSMIPELKNENREPIATYPDLIQPENLGYAAYGKPALGLVILREFILGPDRFDPAFKAYIQRWKYKHPTPRDLFNTIENVAGEELDWFWRGWFYTNKNLDLAVKDVDYVENDPDKGSLITISNKGGLVMPFKVKVKVKGEDPRTIRLPVEVWQRTDEWTFDLNTSSKIRSVHIDPDIQLPDVDRENNTWEGEQ